MSHHLLLLTNPENSEPEEDLFLADFLSQYFYVTVVHPFTTNGAEEAADLILIRNIWPTKNFVEEYQDLYAKLNNTHAKIYNPFDGSGDMRGKTYVVDLYEQGHPVIPSIRSLAQIDQLPETEAYFVKPIHGGSSEGVRKISRQELNSTDLTDYIIEPYLNIKHEVSFYFIDGVLIYALCSPDPLNRWKLEPFQPTNQQIKIATNFVEWNTLSYGIQRIDFCVTNDDQFLLIEIEDWCPYLSLLDISEEYKNKFLDRLVTSLQEKLKA